MDDDGTDDDSSDDPLVNHTPRTRAAILNVTPPVTPYASSEASAQPDSEPDDPGTDEDRVVPADALLGANTDDQTLAVPFRRPFEIIDVRPECGVWVAPTSGTRFHICPACHGLRNATRIMMHSYMPTCGDCIQAIRCAGFADKTSMTLLAYQQVNLMFNMLWLEPEPH